ncbi:hypothetical protein C7M84_003364 [Penaeus vannamei]|uniref:Uncharacterized protein n=1 Tax=Penaeus vannamei TaxID=6689 RepID=A0A3R7SVY0_PENVA|nr:hypothetical protein C7M84_003364 [Penaeus vannamei]
MFVVETARAIAGHRNASDPRRRPRGQPRAQSIDLAARVKGEVYKKVLQQALAHTRGTYKQLVSSAASSSVKEAMLRQWLGFVTESDMALRVLYSLKDEGQSSLQTEKRKMETGDSKNKKETPQPRTLSHDSESYHKRKELEDQPIPTHSDLGRKTTGRDLISLLMGTLLEISRSSNSSASNRSRRSDQGLMYLPIGGTTKVNVMLPPPIPGRKRRASSFRAKWQNEAEASGLDLSRWAESKTGEQELEHIRLDIDKKQGVETSASADGDEALVKERSSKSESKVVRTELRTAKATANRKEAMIVDNAQGSAVPTADSNSTDAKTPPAFEAVTEPSVGDTIEDFSRPTPVPGALGSRSPDTRSSSRGCGKGGRRGVASGLLRAVREWALEAPLLPLQCRGLLWCRGLREASTQDVWLHVLAR